MKSAIKKRLERVEQSFQTRQECVVIRQWAHLDDEERDDRLARWRAGENFEGVSTDVRDRHNAFVLLPVLVSSAKRREVSDQ